MQPGFPRNMRVNRVHTPLLDKTLAVRQDEERQARRAALSELREVGDQGSTLNEEHQDGSRLLGSLKDKAKL